MSVVISFPRVVLMGCRRTKDHRSLWHTVWVEFLLKNVGISCKVARSAKVHIRLSLQISTETIFTIQGRLSLTYGNIYSLERRTKVWLQQTWQPYSGIFIDYHARANDAALEC